MKFYHYYNKIINTEFYGIISPSDDKTHIDLIAILIISADSEHITINKTYVCYFEYCSEVTDPDMINKLNKIMIFE